VVRQLIKLLIPSFKKEFFPLCRLIELAANYFDLASFPDGETKSALQRAWTKRAGGKELSRGDGAGVRSKKSGSKRRKTDQGTLDGRD
jgi:pre-mRNA-splicing factor ATP-dependent RNA helicase DHX15/PRP43